MVLSVSTKTRAVFSARLDSLEAIGQFFSRAAESAGFDERVSVAVDLSVSGPDQTTLVMTATDVLTGAGTAEQAVPEDKTAAVLDAFSASMPGQKLPFAIAPTAQGARGSDVIIEGIADDMTITLDGFRQS